MTVSQHRRLAKVLSLYKSIRLRESDLPVEPLQYDEVCDWMTDNELAPVPAEVTSPRASAWDRRFAEMVAGELNACLDARQAQPV